MNLSVCAIVRELTAICSLERECSRFGRRRDWVIPMTECWACTNPARSNKPRFKDPTAVGCCTRCNGFACNGHVAFDTKKGLLFCALCVAGGDSTPPPGPGPGDQPPDTPTDNSGGPSGLALVFSSLADAFSRFPRFHEDSKAHAAAVGERFDIVEAVERFASDWEKARGESIDLSAVDAGLIAAGFGLTLWSAGLDVGEWPEPSVTTPDWLVTNPLLAMILGNVVY
jgi:hypothetical protein